MKRIIKIIALFLFIAVCGFILLRIFLFQPINIVGSSMEPNYRNDNIYWVRKFSYGYSNYSIPFSPDLFEDRIFSRKPKRGDVVFVRREDGHDSISRVIALPGEQVQIKSGVVFLNGQEIPRQDITEKKRNDDFNNSAYPKYYVETLPNGKKYTILDSSENTYLDNTPAYTVPKGHYFLLNDKRDHATDSRVLKDFGFIPLVRFIGKFTEE